MENSIINMVKTIKISDEIHARLSKHGCIGETYEDVIERLLDFYDSKGRQQIMNWVKIMFILKPVLTDADYKSIGILLQMSTGKYLHRKRMYVLIESPTRTNQLVQLQHIIVKNAGLQNPKCLIPLIYCRVR